MELLVSASFIASFFAGVAALFAPCCVTVLLPTYLASIFKQKTTIFLMTFIYFLGLLAVFLPIGLGVSFISHIFADYHGLIFGLGGGFLIILGLTLTLGFQFSLPILVHPHLKSHGLGSVFILGVFSGIATTCCAPVLAGVLALAAIPGSIFLGGAYTLSYVLGMVTPLLLLSMVLDKTKITEKLFIFRKTVSYKIFNKKINLTLSNLFSGVMFLFLGTMILYLAATSNLISHASYQIEINIFLTKVIKNISVYTRFIPEYIWALIFFLLFALITVTAIFQLKHLLKRQGK